MSKEIRIIAGMSVERRAENDAAPKLVGYAAVFDEETNIGGYFREVIRPGAFAEAIARDDVHALFNHDYGNVLGRKKAGTLTLIEDARGLRVEITPPDTQLTRDLVENIKAGNIDQMSFAFEMDGGKQSWDETSDIPLRAIEQIGSLWEVSVVPRGAYPTTEIGLRSLQDHRKQDANEGYAMRAKRRMGMILALKEREG